MPWGGGCSPCPGGWLPWEGAGVLWASRSPLVSRWLHTGPPRHRDTGAVPCGTNPSSPAQCLVPAPLRPGRGTRALRSPRSPGDACQCLTGAQGSILVQGTVPPGSARPCPPVSIPEAVAVPGCLSSALRSRHRFAVPGRTGHFPGWGQLPGKGPRVPPSLPVTGIKTPEPGRYYLKVYFAFVWRNIICCKLFCNESGILVIIKDFNRDFTAVAPSLGGGEDALGWWAMGKGL